MSIEVMKQWLECVERCDAIDGVYSWSGVVDSLRKAIEQAEQPLTDEQIDALMKTELGYGSCPTLDDIAFARAIEAKIKERNT